ncbi:hypothetical protein CDIK_3286 [Cucumispora dikerogammari]|nr:hypothetical protein CDIK_3286 [Cucumispora dikerogammari]
MPANLISLLNFGIDNDTEILFLQLLSVKELSFLNVDFISACGVSSHFFFQQSLKKRSLKDKFSFFSIFEIRTFIAVLPKGVISINSFFVFVFHIRLTCSKMILKVVVLVFREHSSNVHI